MFLLSVTTPLIGCNLESKTVPSGALTAELKEIPKSSTLPLIVSKTPSDETVIPHPEVLTLLQSIHEVTSSTVLPSRSSKVKC